jgi:hypothetical protein
MADGNGPQAVNFMAPVPFAFKAPSQNYKRKSGPCDNLGEDSRTQLQQFRYAWQLWTFAVAAPGADGLIAAGTQRQSFLEGVGEVGTSLGWGTPVLSQTQTNLFPQGSFNNSLDGAFIGRSLGLSLGRPFIYDATTGERTYSELVDSYAIRAGRALLECMELTMFQRDNAVSLYLGQPQHWPGAHQLVECDYATLNKPNGPLAMMPLRYDYLFVDDNRGSQNHLIGNVPRQIRLISDPAAPLLAGFSIPVLTEVYGDIVSKLAACDVAGSSTPATDRANALIRLMDRGLTKAEAMATLAGT